MQVSPSPFKSRMSHNDQELMDQQNFLMQQQVSFIQQKNEPSPTTSNNVTPEKILPGKTQTIPEKIEEIECGILIQQKWSLMESLSACEFPAVYNIYQKDHRNKKKGKSIFKYKDKSSKCDTCWSVSCAPFNVKAYPQYLDASQRKISCLRLEKRCKCTYYCCNRGEVICYRNDKSEEAIGSIFDLFDCCNFNFELKALEEGAESLFVKTGCCQAYLWCRCPCGNCSKIEFEIFSKKMAVFDPQ